ncbi:MAG: NAD(+)/NADH kinase [Proteobacteria bacterium]|nr:NAD(+)/NADH kinase [Pseudomonadota bacterium]
MKLDRVLVVYKKSLYQLYVREHRDSAVREALRRGDPGVSRLRRSDEVQRAANASVQRTLRRCGIATELRWRGQLRGVRHCDLVVAVGGDGTLLDAARYLDARVPLLGINSDPEGSVGHLCAGTASDLDALVAALRSGTLRPRRRARLRLRLDGKAVLGPCLNEALLAHESPAELSRLALAVLASEALDDAGALLDPVSMTWQASRSSGLWVCTATGATGAMRSAGGRPMGAGSRRLQYLVREPFHPPSASRKAGWRGFVEPDAALVAASRMRRARLWADGPHRSVALRYGQTVVVDGGAPPLLLVPRLA